MQKKGYFLCWDEDKKLWYQLKLISRNVDEEKNEVFYYLEKKGENTND